MIFSGDDELIVGEVGGRGFEWVGEIERREGEIFGPGISGGEVDAVDVILVGSDVEMG